MIKVDKSRGLFSTNRSARTQSLLRWSQKALSKQLNR